MENAEEIFHFLEDFSKRKPKTIPQELNDYLAFVARTGDPVYQWSLVKCLFKEKFLNVITDFHETSPGIDIPTYPNVDPFNYDIMKNSLLERLDSFTSAPFTVQRICELLAYPRKQYNRIDKYMRAIEKNILVVSTREPGPQRHNIEHENGEPIEPIVNGSDNTSDYNVDVEMEDISWKESNSHQNSEPQPSSSDTHISINDIEARLQAKQNNPLDLQEKITTQYESVTPPEINVDEPNIKPDNNELSAECNPTNADKPAQDNADLSSPIEPKMEIELKSDIATNSPLVIPEIRIDDVEATNQRINEEMNSINKKEDSSPADEGVKIETVPQVAPIQDIGGINSEVTTKEEEDLKPISEISSEESSSSSDNTDGNSNSPKTDSEVHIDIQEDTTQPESKTELDVTKEEEKTVEMSNSPSKAGSTSSSHVTIQSDNYSISDVNSELPQMSAEITKDELAESEVKDVTEEKEESKAEAVSESTSDNKDH